MLSEQSSTNIEEQWSERLRGARGHDLTLSRDIVARPVGSDLSNLPGTPDLALPAGTVVRYDETRYDSMRPDMAFHVVKVVSGPDAGAWAFIGDVIGPGPLPWEALPDHHVLPRRLRDSSL